MSWPSISDTRWSSRHDSVKSVLHNYSALLKSLEEISGSCEVKSDVRAAAKGHLSMIAESKFVLFLCFREKVLGIANVVSKYLQKSEIDLNPACALVQELINKVEEYSRDGTSR